MKVKCVTTVPLRHPVSPQFDVSFPEKLLKIVANRGWTVDYGTIVVVVAMFLLAL